MLNRIYIIVGIIAILALAGAFIAPRFIQWGDYRDRMELLAEGVFGTEVTIRGDIDFALLPAPRLAFSDVVIGPAERPAATVGAVEAQFALMDFLRDQYNLSALILKSPVIAFELDENGLLTSGVDLSGAGGGVALDQARIENGRLTLADRRSGSTYELSAINGDLRLGSFAGPFQFQGSATRDGTAYSLRLNSGVVDDVGSARVSAFIAEVGGRGSLTLDGALVTGQAPKFDGTMILKQAPPPAERAEQIRGNLVLESKVTASTDRIVLNGYTLLPDENRAGMRLTGAASIQLGARTSFEAVVSGGVFTLPPRDAEEDASLMPYELVRLLGELPAPPLPPIPGEIGIDLAEIGLRGAALRNVRVDASTNGDIWTISRAEAELPGSTKVNLSGALRNDSGVAGFNGDISITTTRLDALSQLWRKTSENSPLFNVPAELSGQVMLAGDALGFSHGRLVLNDKVHVLELRLGFGEEPRLDLVGRFDDLAPGDSAILAAMFPDPNSDRTFGTSFPEGSFSFNSQTIRILGLEAQDLIAEGSWSGSGLRFSKLVSSNWGGIGINASGDLAGTLAKPALTGSGHVDVGAANAPALGAIYGFLGVPANWRPVLDRSVPASLDFSLLGGDSPGSQRFTLNGTAGIAHLDLAIDMAGGLSGVGEGRVQIIGSLESANGGDLVRQLDASDTPLFSGNESAFLSLFAEGDAAAGFDARLSIGQGNELLAFGGELSVLESGELAGTGTLDIALDDGSGLAALAGGTGIGLGSLEASAGVEFYGLQSIAITGIAGRSSGTAFSGDIAVDQVAQRPSVQGALHFDRLPGRGLAGALLSPAALVPGDGVWPEGPLATSSTTRTTRGTIEVTAGEIAIGASTLTDAAFDLTWDQQSLAISNFKGSIGGGSLNATLSHCCAGPLTDRTITGRVSLDNVQVSALVTAEASAGLSASLTGSGSFEGTGASLAEVISSLAGEGNFSLADLSLDRLNPGVYPALAGLQDVLNIDAEALDILIDQSLGQGPFNASKANGAFAIAGGTLRLANLIIEGSGARLAGGIDFALSSLGLNGSFVLTPFSYVDPSGLIENDAARIVARLSGTFLAPVVELDTTELIAAIQVRANELEVDRLEALRIEDEERQRAAAAERNRLIEEQRRKAAEEAAARAAAEEAARQALEQQQGTGTTPPVETPETPAPTAPTVPLNLGFQPGVNNSPTGPVNLLFR
ncbi:AsmA family protein [Devosia sp. LjRoot3]|uniref:AsmA family protein n=1 Tax=Devosia sp. LjRoot3 TaxID=3342319 RepID=UPI003ECF8A1D